MPIVDIFSKRQKRLRGEFPDVYQYETIPHELRIQVIYIWRDAFGKVSRHYIQEFQSYQCRGIPTTFMPRIRRASDLADQILLWSQSVRLLSKGRRNKKGN